MLTALDRLRCAWATLRARGDARRAHHLQVVITDRCNLACTGCSKVELERRPTNRDMPRERLELLLERFAPRLVTLLGEGDPLLHRDLLALVRACVARRARPILATNLSVGAPDDFDALVDAGLAGAKVTLAASQRRRYQHLKGRDLFDEVLARVTHLRTLGVPILLELWLDRESVAGAERHVRFAHEHRLRRVSFLWPEPEEERRGGALGPEALASLDRAQRLAQRLGVKSNLHALRRARAPGSRQVGRCALPWVRAYVDLDGRVGPCVDLVVKRRSEGAPPLADGFVDARPYASDGLQELRRRFLRGETPHAICEGCRRCRVPAWTSLAPRRWHRHTVSG